MPFRFSFSMAAQRQSAISYLQYIAPGWEKRARLMDRLRPHLVKLYSGWEGTAAVSDIFYIINRKR